MEGSLFFRHLEVGPACPVFYGNFRISFTLGETLRFTTNDITLAWGIFILISIKLIFSIKFPPALAGGKIKSQASRL
jgi:hypothetical protein